MLLLFFIPIQVTKEVCARIRNSFGKKERRRRRARWCRHVLSAQINGLHEFLVVWGSGSAVKQKSVGRREDYSKA